MINIDERTILDCDWIAPPMPWIDPQREAAADEISVRAGFESRQGIIRKRGGSVSRIDQEIEADAFEAPEATDPSVAAIRR
jgi:capsid protein